MTQQVTVTDEDLARARRDSTFRRQLLAESMERLLDGLNKLRRAEPNAANALQIRQGVELAVRLADLLQRAGVRAL
jgi:hypothetical protein